MEALQKLASKLLQEGTVKVVIGYEEGPKGIRPAFITSPDQCQRLVFNSRCVHNLAVFLSPRRSQVAALGRPAIVVKPCDAKAVAGLLRETQIKREDVEIISVRCGGVVRDPSGTAELNEKTVADRCVGCELKESSLSDHVVGQEAAAPAGTQRHDEKVAQLDNMSPKERWDFWQNEFKKCIRCYACRQVCPLCYCERCIFDKTRPQWVESSAHARGNLPFHMTRAQHLAGRCVTCDECERACPMGIPIGLLNRKMAKVMKERFEYQTNDNPEEPAPIGTFRLDDEQEFIV